MSPILLWASWLNSYRNDIGITAKSFNAFADKLKNGECRPGLMMDFTVEVDYFGENLRLNSFKGSEAHSPENAHPHPVPLNGFCRIF
jgi:hypothetical protein